MFSGTSAIRPPLSNKQCRDVDRLAKHKLRSKCLKSKLERHASTAKHKTKRKPKPKRANKKPLHQFTPVLANRPLSLVLNAYCMGVASGNRLGSAFVLYSGSKLEFACIGQSRKGSYEPRAHMMSIGLELRFASGSLSSSFDIQLFSESDYEVAAITEYAYAQRKRQWKTADGSPAKNADLIKPIHNLYDKMNRWLVVSATSGKADSATHRTLEELCAYSISAQVDDFLLLDCAVDAQLDFIKSRTSIDLSGL